MTADDRSERPMFSLEPRGAASSPRKIGLLAQAGGTLVGAIVNGVVRTWLADDDGQLTLVMWPRDFQARVDPLEIIDDHNEPVAHGGRLVLVAGGYLKTQDARALGHQKVFCAWKASEAEDSATAREPALSRRRPFRDERLPTTEDEVADLSAAVAQGCSLVPWVSAAFICRVRRRFSDDGSVQTFLAALVIVDSPPEERRPTSRELLASLPPSMQEGGIHVLTATAVGNAEPLGVQVYQRSDRERSS